jgi:predicted dehydrogenase
MGEVIYVDFSRQHIPVMSEREQFLHLLAIELDELDFQDFVEAVNEPQAYENLDEDMKDLVDIFFQKAS